MRDGNIVKNYRREINLQTKTIKNKKAYNRKEKYKEDYMEVTEKLDNLKFNGENLFGKFPIQEDEFGEKFVCISYNEEYYMDSEEIEQLKSASESQEDMTFNGQSYGTVFCLGYNL